MATTVLLCAMASATVPVAASVPDFSVTRTDGANFSLKAERGHWLIINYWATWCAACLEEMPILTTFAKSHPAVTLVGLTYEDIGLPALREFLGQHPPGYPVALVHEKNLPRLLKPTYLGMHALPLTLLIAPDGAQSQRWVGELDATKLDEIAARVTYHERP